MPIFLLDERPVFPPAELATPEGIIAIGGDLSPQRLLSAYAGGIFPWFNEDDPILWWSPDPRLVLFPGKLHVSSSMKKLLAQNAFDVTIDTNFEEVIRNCSNPRKTQKGTWITNDIIRSYTALHEMGYAHSIEVWQDNRLVGGFYGSSLGSCFFGESMFYKVSNASKYGFIVFVRKLFEMGFTVVDCQVPTSHLKSLGAEEITREKFLVFLDEGLKSETRIGKWDFLNKK